MSKAIEQATQFFHRLSERERRLLFIVIVTVLLLFAALIYSVAASSLAKAEHRVSEKQKNIAQIEALQGEYTFHISETQKILEKVRSNNVRLFSYIEDLAKKNDVEIANMSERSGALNEGEVKEVIVEVIVNKVSIDKLMNFLTKIEEENPLVKVQKLKIQTRFDDSTILDSTFSVATYQSKNS